MAWPWVFVFWCGGCQSSARSSAFLWFVFFFQKLLLILKKSTPEIHPVEEDVLKVLLKRYKKENIFPKAAMIVGCSKNRKKLCGTVKTQIKTFKMSHCSCSFRQGKEFTSLNYPTSLPTALQGFSDSPVLTHRLTVGPWISSHFLSLSANSGYAD